MSSKDVRGALDRTIDIIEAIEALQRLAGRHDRCSFVADIDAQKLARHDLFVIGEAANFLAPGIQDRHPQIPWNKIRGLRNVIVHEYFRVDADAIWGTISTGLPELAAAMNAEREYLESVTPSP